MLALPYNRYDDRWGAGALMPPPPPPPSPAVSPRWDDPEEVKNRVEQVLAESSLAQLPGQYPLDITVGPRRAGGTPMAARSQAQLQIEEALDNIAGKGVALSLRADPSFAGAIRLSTGPGPLSTSQAVGQSVALSDKNLPAWGVSAGTAISTGPDDGAPVLLDIVSTLSEGTAQGTVYSVDIGLPSSPPMPMPMPMPMGLDQGQNQNQYGNQVGNQYDGPYGDQVVNRYVNQYEGQDGGGYRNPFEDQNQIQIQNQVQNQNQLQNQLQNQGVTHAVDVYSKAYGLQRGVPAVMKKSPIYPVDEWLRYNVVGDLVEYKAGNARRPPYVGPPLFGPVDSDALPASGLLALRAAQDGMRADLDAAYANPNNDAYVDALGYYLGSQLVENGVVPFFPLVYLTARAYDTAYFGPAAVARYGPGINEGFPVQLTVMQALGKSLNQLVEEGFFYTTPPPGRKVPFRRQPRRRRLDERKVLSMQAQVTFGLAAAQAILGLVNNDAHNGNFLTESVGPGDVLYYEDPRTDKVYAVPTYGLVYKMIDFGRATFRVGGTTFGSNTQDAVWGGNWDLRSMSNDLVRWASVFAVRTDALDGLPPSSPALAYFEQVLDCGPAGNVVRNYQRCADDPNIQRANDCRDLSLGLMPFVLGNTCINGIPSRLMHHFESFVIPRSKVPRNATVYTVFSQP